MCFLKSYYSSNGVLASQDSLQAKLFPNFSHPEKTFPIEEIQGPENDIFDSNSFRITQSMSSLISIALQNEKVIISLQDVFFTHKQKIEEGFKKLEESGTQDQEYDQVLNEKSEAAKIENFHQKLITYSKTGKNISLKQKLFGDKQYQYKIQLDGQFPQQILKERNFGFNVKLLSGSGSIIKNSKNNNNVVNPIKLVLGVCDNEGKWISCCGSGMDFMKGNCEIQMLHGVADFRKIYPREVSRGFVDQQVNFVVYTQPSVLKYLDSINRWEEYVDPLEVEPLFINKIVIRAKKMPK